MSELDVLVELEAKTGLLEPRFEREAMRRTSYQFTMTVLADPRMKKWAAVRADPPLENINGRRLDKIIHRENFTIVDIIINSDDPTGGRRTVQWDEKGVGVPRDVIEPEPVSGGGGGSGGGSGGGGGVDEEVFREFVMHHLVVIETLLQDTIAAWMELTRKINELARDGVKVRWR